MTAATVLLGSSLVGRHQKICWDGEVWNGRHWRTSRFRGARLHGGRGVSKNRGKSPTMSIRKRLAVLAEKSA